MKYIISLFLMLFCSNAFAAGITTYPTHGVPATTSDSIVTIDESTSAKVAKISFSGDVNDTLVGNGTWQEAIEIVAGEGIVIDDSGNPITISATGSSGAAITVQTADPTASSAVGWYAATGSGDIFYKSNAGLFTVAGSYTADPVFYTLTVSDPGSGSTITCTDADLSVSLNCGNGNTTCSASVESGDEITGLTATAGSGLTFSAWTVDVTSSENPTTTALTMNAAKSIGASFSYAGSWFAGVVETFEQGAGDFVTDEWAISANTNGGVVSTYSTTAGTLITTHSLEIDDDTVGNHSTDYVYANIPVGEQDNTFSIRFKYKGLSLPDAYNGLSFLQFRDDTADVARMGIYGNNGTGGDGPNRLTMTAQGGKSSGYVRTAYTAGDVICVEIRVNPYTGATNTSSIIIYDSDCSSNSATTTFEIASGLTIDSLRFGGILNDADDHHYGIDALEFKAAGGAF